MRRGLSISGRYQNACRVMMMIDPERGRHIRRTRTSALVSRPRGASLYRWALIACSHAAVTPHESRAVTGRRVRSQPKQGVFFSNEL